MKLALLIPTTPDRKEYLDRLITEILRQMNELQLSGGVHEPDNLNLETDVCILINSDNKENTTGKKRNELMQWAMEWNAEYIAFIDDDDLPGPTYIKRGMEVVASGFHCGELWGQFYSNGKKGMPFHHYLGCTHAWEDDKQYHRPPNHLNFWKTELIKDFKFQDKTFGEDMTWAMEILQSGVIKTMYLIPEVIYHYYSGNPKHEIV